MQHFADEPDDTRPRNPWPRLLALGGFLLVIILGFGACLVSFVSTGAAAELRVPLDQLQTGVPRFEPVTRWGADPNGFTYGAWIVETPEDGTRALFNRNVRSTCTVEWLPTEQVGETTGVFRDRCDGAAFDITGAPIDGPAARHLDHFELEVVAAEVVVNVKTLRIGNCIELVATSVICESNGPITRVVPLTGSIPAEFARN
jgi:hypothetical protein